VYGNNVLISYTALPWLRERPMVCSYEYANDPAVFIKFQKFLDLATTIGLPRKT